MGECPKAVSGGRLDWQCCVVLTHLQERCRYSHEYELTEEQLKELAKIAKALPCSYVNNGVCFDSDI